MVRESNLIDLSKITTGYGFVSGSAELESASGWYVTDYCEVEPNTKYKYFNISSTNTRVFDINKNLIEIQTNNEKIINVPSNGHYVRFNSKIEGYQNPQLYKYNEENSYGEIVHRRGLGTILWENGNISTPFENQNITLASDDYDYLITFYCFDTRDENDRNYRMGALTLKGGNMRLGLHGGTNSGFRRALYVNDTTYNFGEGMYGGNTNNNYAVPAVIYGCKLGE